MSVDPVASDVPAVAKKTMQSQPPDRSAFGKALDAYGAVFVRAGSAEEDFAAGKGSLQAAIYERARADVALAVAVSAAQRAAQALQAFFSMPV